MFRLFKSLWDKIFADNRTKSLGLVWRYEMDKEGRISALRMIDDVDRSPAQIFILAQSGVSDDDIAEVLGISLHEIAEIKSCWQEALSFQ